MNNWNFNCCNPGCRECMHHAPNTFTMDENLGCARVKVQDGDTDTKIEVGSILTNVCAKL